VVTLEIIPGYTLGLADRDATTSVPSPSGALARWHTQHSGAMSGQDGRVSRQQPTSG